MLKKIYFFLVIIIVGYALLAYNFPTKVQLVEDFFWLPHLSQGIISFKSTFDDTVTNIPTKEELEQAYTTIYSGAVEYSEKAKEGLDITKWKIDEVRQTLSGAGDVYIEGKALIEQTGETIDAIWQVVDAVQKVQEEVSATGTNQ